jgi:multidrug resistance efflux pump
MNIQRRPAGRHARRANFRRRGISTLGISIGAGGLAIVVIAAVTAIGMLGGGDEDVAGPLFHKVERGVFVFDITAAGQVESANNRDFRCEVKSQGGGGTQIIEVISEGSNVVPGDILVKLDSSKLKIDLDKQRLTINTARARVIQAQNNFDTAKIAKKEYLEGIYEQEQQTIQSLIFVAEEGLSRAEEYLRFSKRLAAKGYVTSQQLRADQFAVDKAINSLAAANKQLEVLQKFTHEKTTKQLEADMASAKAILEAEQNAFDLEQETLKQIQSQIDKCTIRSTHAGKVVHKNETSRRGGSEVVIEPGTVVREHQVLIRLPDPNNMQVKAKVNEAHIRLIQEDMPVSIKIDAMPDNDFWGKIALVNPYPEPGSWYGGSVKEFMVYVDIIQPEGGFPDDQQLKTGMTAQISIHVDERKDVLQIPVQAVNENDGELYCIVRGESDWQYRKVTLGPTNSEYVIVKGLEVGDMVATNPDHYLDKIDKPKISDEEKANYAKRAKRGRPQGKVAARGNGTSPAAMAGQMIKRMDKNSDGRLSVDELPAGMSSRFAEIDSNGDQSVDVGELTAAMARMKRPGGREPRGRGGNAKRPVGAG